MTKIHKDTWVINLCNRTNIHKWECFSRRPSIVGSFQILHTLVHPVMFSGWTRGQPNGPGCVYVFDYIILFFTIDI